MNCEQYDKRTKAYKECMKLQEETTEEQEPTFEERVEKFEANNGVGLGDIVEKVTKATGIKKAVEWVKGEDCGCDERKKRFNKTRFKRRVPNCFTETEYNTLTKLLAKPYIELTHYDVEEVVKIEERIYNKRYSGKVCGSCGEFRRIYNDIKEIYEMYQ